METSGRQASLYLSPGTLVAGRFEVCERIGAGGMGLVFRAVDRELDEEVALKLLHPHLAQEESVFRRFRNEVLIARSLSHPAIVRTHDIGRADNGYSYISMELIRGKSLREYLEVGRKEDEQEGSRLIDVEQAATILLQVLSAIAYAHSKGIIHRDLKPANILLTEAGEVKIADFGMARIMGIDNSITRAGQVVGTPDYMAPEQIRGEELDSLCDIYSIGIIAYEMVAAKRPFQADSPVAVAFKHLNEALPPLPDGVPEWYKEATTKATAKIKDERFATAAEYAQALLEHIPQKQSAYLGAVGTVIAAVGRQSWSADFSTPSLGTEEEEQPRSHSAADSGWSFGYPAVHSAAADRMTEYGKVDEPSRRLSRSLLLYCGILGILLLGGIAVLTRTVPTIRERVSVLLTRPGVQPYAREALPALLGIELLTSAEEGDGEEDITMPKRDPIREQLRAELLAIESSAAETITSREDGEAQGEAVITTEADVEQSATKAEFLTFTFTPWAESAGTSAAADDAIEDADTATLPGLPTALSEPSLKSSAILLYRGGRELRGESPAISVDHSDAVSWGVLIENVPEEGRAELRKKLSLNIFDPRLEKAILRLDAQEVERRGSEVHAKGSLVGLLHAKPDTGNLRLDLIYDDELLGSRPITLYRASVQLSSEQGKNAERISIVRVPTIIESLEPGRPDAPELRKGEQSEAQGKSGGSRESNVRPQQTFMPRDFNRPSRDLAPARAVADNLALDESPQAPETAVVREVFRGTLSFSEQKGESSRALVLRLAYSGSSIQGSATIAGFEPFRISGQVFPRGLELDLQNGRERFRLTGARRDNMLRGLYQFSGPAESTRGSWSAGEVN